MTTRGIVNWNLHVEDTEISHPILLSSRCHFAHPLINSISANAAILVIHCRPLATTRIHCTPSQASMLSTTTTTVSMIIPDMKTTTGAVRVRVWYSAGIRLRHANSLPLPRLQDSFPVTACSQRVSVTFEDQTGISGAVGLGSGQREARAHAACASCPEIGLDAKLYLDRPSSG